MRTVVVGASSGRFATAWFHSHHLRHLWSSSCFLRSYVGLHIWMRLTSWWLARTISCCCRSRQPMLSDFASTAAPNVVVFSGTRWSIVGTWCASSRTPPPHSRVLWLGFCGRSRILESFSRSLKFSISIACARSSSSCARFKFIRT